MCTLATAPQECRRGQDRVCVYAKIECEKRRSSTAEIIIRRRRRRRLPAQISRLEIRIESSNMGVGLSSSSSSSSSAAGGGGGGGGGGGSVLDDSAWLRTVVQHHQKRRGGVSEFESFSVEPAHTVDLSKAKAKAKAPRAGAAKAKAAVQLDTAAEAYQEFGVRLYRVSSSFTDGRAERRRRQRVSWVVKEAVRNRNRRSKDGGDGDGGDGVQPLRSLSHEVKVYSTLLPELRQFLSTKSHPRAKFLINIPDLIFLERKFKDGLLSRCHLVLEDVTATKRCSPLEYSDLEAGITLQDFKVYLGTLAQFHAVGLAWGLGRRPHLLKHLQQQQQVPKQDKQQDANSSPDNGDPMSFLNKGKAIKKKKMNNNLNNSSNGSRESSPAAESCCCDSATEGDGECARLLAMYEKLLRWQQKVRRKRAGCLTEREKCREKRREEGMRRRLKLCAGLAAGASDILAQSGASADGADDDTPSLHGLCLGPVSATDIMFQRPGEEDREVMEMQAPGAPGANGAPCASPSAPLCAAVLTCHRVHLGPICRDLALALLALPAPCARRHYLVHLLQGYAFTLSATLEVLDVDWSRQFGVTFVQLVDMFYQQVPHAMLRSILMHMRLTDPAELDSAAAAAGVVVAATVPSSSSSAKRAPASSRPRGGLKGAPAASSSTSAEGERHFWLPLTEERVEFLLGLTDPVVKVTS